MPAPMLNAESSGFKELQQALSELPKAVSKAVLRTALKKVGQPVADMAGSLASAYHDTGRFSQSFEVKTTLSKRQKKARGKTGAEAVVYVGSTDRKAHLIEFGTAPHLILPKTKKVLANTETVFASAVAHPGTSPRPVLRPAWDAMRQTVQTTLGKEMWKALDKARKRLAKKAAKAAAA